MKLFDLIDHARKQPEDARRAIALTVSVIITLIIFGFWVVSFGVDVSQRASVADSNVPSPLGAIKEIINGAKGEN